MTTPPPPWEAHPPLPDGDGFHGAEPPSRSDERSDGPAEGPGEHFTGPVGERFGEGDDSDGFDDTATGPVRVVRPEADPSPAGRYQPAPDLRPLAPPRRSAVAYDPFADRFAAPMTVDPRTSVVRRVGGNRTALVAVAAVAAVVLVTLAAVLLWPSGGGSGDAPNAAEAPRDSATVQRLKALLPAGYSTDSCSTAEVPSGAEAKLTCGQNADADGPPTATYTLMTDADTLKVAMDDVIANAGIVNCPRNTLSPGPWRRNATPGKVAGNLVCGLPQGKPMIAWTNDADSVLSMVRAGPTGPTLDQLYDWWSNHS